MDVLELPHTHTFILMLTSHHICHVILFGRPKQGDSIHLRVCVFFFTPFCLYSWKGLKNTKHFIVIKVARRIRLLAFGSTRSMCFRFFHHLELKTRREKILKNQNQLTAEVVWVPTLWDIEYMGNARFSNEINRNLPHHHRLVHSSFINRITLIRYR